MYKQYKIFKNFYFIFLLLSFILIVTLIIPGCDKKPVETNLLLPVEFSSIPSNLILTSPLDEKIEIRVSGDIDQIEAIKNLNLKYFVDLYTDLASDPAGEKNYLDPRIYYLPVLEKRIFVPPGVKILMVKPAYIKVNLEKKVIKSFPVTVPYVGKEAAGYVALSARIEPEKVMLTGPESIIRSIQTIKTKPIDLTNIKESFKKKIPVELQGLNTKSNPRIITVYIPIEKIQTTKVFEKLPVELKNARHGCSVNPSTIMLTIKGGHDILNKQETKENIKISIDVKGLKSGVYVRRAVIDLPLGLIMTDAEPEIFTVTIE